FMLPLALFGASRLAMMGHGGRRGPGPFGGRPPFGPDGEPPFRPGGPGFGPGGRLRDALYGGGPFGRARRARRGDVRAGILALLKEETRNGYQIIQELGQRSGGAWRPSPGSVYPALQQLEDEGLVRAEESDGKRTFRLTEAGVAYTEAHSEEVTAPWDVMAEGVDNGAREVGGMIQQVAMAAMQVVQTGSAAQLAEARKVLTATRRSLYRILAEDEPTDGEAPTGQR
ncbi:MAG TPA: PadR family transcriptional regulator, partial [Thermomicrobiales bacterium]